MKNRIDQNEEENQKITENQSLKMRIGQVEPYDLSRQ